MRIQDYCLCAQLVKGIVNLMRDVCNKIDSIIRISVEIVVI
jgi:hypothetical protein